MKILVQPRFALVLALALLLVGSALGPAAAADKETRKRWILKMSHSPLRTVVVRDAGGRSSAYHYMTLKVTNGTKFARGWHPLAKAITDTKKTYLAGGYSDALGAIRKRERNNGLVAIGTTAGRLKAGATIDTVAIFGPLDSLYDRVNVQVYGLVDSIAIYKVEQYGDKSEGGKVVLGKDSVIVDSAYWDHNQGILSRLKKAAAESGGDVPKPHVEYQEVSESRYWTMNYERLGDEFHAEDDIITFKGEGWKIRGTVGGEGGPKGLRVISTEG